MSRLIRYAHKSTGGWVRSVLDTHRNPVVAVEVDYDATREDILRALAGLTAAIKNDKEIGA
jgi:hypothetical protein